MNTDREATTTAAVPAPAAHVSTAIFDGETVLYDAVRCRPILLNVSAAAVWAAVDGRRTLAEVAAVVAERFGATTAELAADVAATVAKFEALDLLATVPG